MMNTHPLRLLAWAWLNRVAHRAFSAFGVCGIERAVAELFTDAKPCERRAFAQRFVSLRAAVLVRCRGASSRDFNARRVPSVRDEQREKPESTERWS